MSSDLMPVAENSIRAIDSLVANEFVLEIDGEAVSGIFAISGLISFKLEVKTTNQLKKSPETFKIRKMVQRDPHSAFNQWLRETQQAGIDIVRPTRTLTIVAVDDGVPIRRWIVKKAWVSELSYSDFNTASSEMVEEVVTVRYEDIEESWPLLDA